MNPSDYVVSKRIVMKTAQEFAEKWVQDLILKDPTILGLGQLEFRIAEKTQPTGGRVDLILADPETDRRYEVEIQLGATDESHIIRTIEYWDNERKRYPQFEHCAVIIAEDITSRFFNVISLFNRSIPLIAIQMRLLQVAEKVTLAFTTVLDETPPDDPDPDPNPVTADRSYWIKRASEETIALVDKLFSEIVLKVVDNVQLNYLQNYIGLSRNGRSNNFVYFIPKREVVRFHLKHASLPEIDDEIEKSGMQKLAYDRRHNFYKLKIASEHDIEDNREFLLSLVERAHRFMNE